MTRPFIYSKHSTDNDGEKKTEQSLALFTAKMAAEHIPQDAINTFSYYYRQLILGNLGQITEQDIEPVRPEEILPLSAINSCTSIGLAELSRTVIIKLNGGLGTTMGLKGAKSLIPIKNNLHFLDITALQVRSLQQKTRVPLPLLLMNSFRTAEQSLLELAKYPDLTSELPQSFLQHKFPKIDATSFSPARAPEQPQLEWNPPGHGDLYSAFATSGILDTLLKKGFKYAFISNIDNLGASMDPAILGYLIKHSLAFLMEVTERTWMDRKGGHIARLKNGQLILREAAQCSDEDRSHFKDITKHRYFNTNNLWIDLHALSSLLSANSGVLKLPLICNKKYLDPADLTSATVFQLESAMGSALSVLQPSQVLTVPRSRFIPVKTCDELLLLWSDYYHFTEEFTLVPAPESLPAQPTINLDPRFYATLEMLKTRFPAGAPSLQQCSALSIVGDVRFGKNITIIGEISLTNHSPTPFSIPDGTTIKTDLSKN